MIDLTDDEPSKKAANHLNVSVNVPNGSIRNSESVQNRNHRQRYRDKEYSSVVQKDSAVINTIIGQIKLPTPPQPPKFEKAGVPDNVKALPRKLKIEANFEGKNNMKVTLFPAVCLIGQNSPVALYPDTYNQTPQ